MSLAFQALKGVLGRWTIRGLQRNIKAWGSGEFWASKCSSGRRGMSLRMGLWSLKRVFGWKILFEPLAPLYFDLSQVPLPSCNPAHLFRVPIVPQWAPPCSAPLSLPRLLKPGVWVRGRRVPGKAAPLVNEWLSSIWQRGCRSRMSPCWVITIQRENSKRSRVSPPPPWGHTSLSVTQGSACAFRSQTLKHLMSWETRVYLPCARAFCAAALPMPWSRASWSLLTLPGFERFG